tara:strand:+ start:1289 stop:1492 length:204 start_codon:yes stop_codon:yes gene_type:complete
MGWLLKVYLGDNETYIRFFNLFSIGFIHPNEEEVKVKGLMLGIWNFQIQLTFAYDNRSFKLGDVYEA